MVYQNCRHCVEKDQLSNGDSVSKNSFAWLPLSILFLCSIFVPQELGNKVTTHRAPYSWRALIWWVTTSVLYSPWHFTSHLGFGGPEPCLLSKGITPSTVRIPRVGFWRHFSEVTHYPLFLI
jgi:hypothetical protein